MLLGINQLSSYGKSVRTYHYSRNNTPSFQGVSKSLFRSMGYAFVAAGLLAFSSCANNKKDIQEDVVEISSETTDISSVPDNELQNDVVKTKTQYYYSPKDGNIVSSEQYDWVETIYPDGSIKKDSMGYDISITPDGKRTVVKNDKNQLGLDSVTTILPDGSKVVGQYYVPDKDMRIKYMETYYRPDSTIKDVVYYSEYLSDSLYIGNPRKQETSHYFYNDKSVLLKWTSKEQRHATDSAHNKYDNQNRLIYDSLNQEKYIYKGNNRIPHSSEAEHEGCKRITIYGDSGNIDKIYFKASDGTITEEK